MILYLNEKVTAVEFAKLVLTDYGVKGAKEKWSQLLGDYDDGERLTENDTLAIEAALERHSKRLKRFFGVQEIINKMWQRK